MQRFFLPLSESGLFDNTCVTWSHIKPITDTYRQPTIPTASRCGVGSATEPLPMSRSLLLLWLELCPRAHAAPGSFCLSTSQAAAALPRSLHKMGVKFLLLETVSGMTSWELLITARSTGMAASNGITTTAILILVAASGRSRCAKRNSSLEVVSVFCF